MSLQVQLNCQAVYRSIMRTRASWRRYGQREFVRSRSLIGPCRFPRRPDACRIAWMTRSALSLHIQRSRVVCLLHQSASACQGRSVDRSLELHVDCAFFTSHLPHSPLYRRELRTAAALRLRPGRHEHHDFTGLAEAARLAQPIRSSEADGESS
jgi:hypothetical protein